MRNDIFPKQSFLLSAVDFAVLACDTVKEQRSERMIALRSDPLEYKSANYPDDSIRCLSGDEPFVDGAASTQARILDFWRWAYSDLLRNTQRGVLAEFIVKLALEKAGIACSYPMRLAFEPYDLLGPEVPEKDGSGPPRYARIEVKSAAYIQAWQQRHPNQKQTISFGIAPAKIPDETGDYRDDAPRQRNADLYVFCLFTPPAEKRGANILDLSLWRFYVAKTNTVNRVCSTSGRVTLQSSKFSAIVENDRPLRFAELSQAIIDACKSL